MKYFPFLFLLTFTSIFPIILKAQNQPDTGYVNQIIKERKEKDELFKTKNSPIPKEEIEHFKGLNYFPADKDFVVEAAFIRTEHAKKFKMKTTTDRLPEFVEYGKLIFLLKGEKFILSVYQSLDLKRRPGLQDYLFLPIKDETTSVETYGGGRFIDLRIPKGNTMIIDFNQAYNPDCAYNHTSSCPIPPKENKLKIKILAGEKQFSEF